MIKARNFICISTSDWDLAWGSKQQLMLKLSLDNRVFYVEYQASFLHMFFRPTRRRIFKILGSLKSVNENLFVYTLPPFLLPFGYYLRFINKINQRIISYFILRQLKKLNFNNPILWIYPPCAVDLINHIDKSLMVYHCIADFSCEKKGYLRRKTILGMEEELLKKVDIIAAMSKDLFERFSKARADVIYFPSAVDFEFFQKKFNETLEIPADLKSIKKPILGIVAYVDSNILDIELLKHLVLKKPQWSLVFVGPIVKGANFFKDLSCRSNVHFLGAKNHNDIPLYIKFFDVCLIPYKKNKFIKNVSPLKLYEYLAMGKPVIATTSFSEAREFNTAVTCADEKDSFIEAIEKALAENDADAVNMRIDIARQNSWDRRLENSYRLINNYLSSKNNCKTGVER